MASARPGGDDARVLLAGSAGIWDDGSTAAGVVTAVCATVGGLSWALVVLGAAGRLAAFAPATALNVPASATTYELLDAVPVVRFLTTGRATRGTSLLDVLREGRTPALG